MGSKSNYLENAILDHVLGKGTANLTSPANLFLALFLSGNGPGETGGGTEVSASGYARQALTFSAASSGSKANSAAVEFWSPSGASGTVGTIGHWGIYDASSAGNLLYYGDVTTPQSITAGGIFRVNAAALTVTED